METFVTQVQLSNSVATDLPGNIEQSIKQHVEEEDGRLVEFYPILGGRGTDLIVVCTFPNDQAALKAWLGLSYRFGWRTQTNPSIDKQQFVKDYQAIREMAVSTAVHGGATRSTGR